MSTIKVNTLTTLDGTGNITLSRPLSGSGASLTSLPAANLTGTLPAIDGSNLTGVAPTKAAVEALGIDLPAANLTGTVADARFPATLPASSGVNLTALNASNISSGTLPAGRYTDTVYTHPTGAGNKHIPTAGATDQVLTYSSSGTAAWSTPAGGGKVLQILQTQKTDTQNGNADSWVTVTGLTQAITPSATSSKILVMISLTYQGPTSNNARFKMVRTAPSLTDICVSDASGNRLPAYAMMNRDASQGMDVACMVFLDEPSTTSAVTYGAQCRATYDTQTWYINDAATSSNTNAYSKGASTITCIEIGA